MNTLSVVISAWNEEEKIERTLLSVRWADEIVVVDSGSTDKTAELAKKYTSKIFHLSNNAMLNVNKNYGFTKATGDWVLSLDADEVVTPELAEEIKSKISFGKTKNGKNQKLHSDAVVGYWIPRKNIIFGKWIEHGLWWPDKQLRLFQRGSGRFPEKHIHEYLSVDGPTGELTEPYIHHNYESISQFLRKMDMLYTENEVLNLRAAGYQFAWYDALRFPVSDFVKVLFAQEGYKDGLHGLVLAMLQGFYSFIVFAKLWEAQKFTPKDIQPGLLSGELIKSKKEIQYWMLDVLIKSTPSAVKKNIYKIFRHIQKPG